jgi:uncharacterized FlaG/YvyC family protein
MIPVVAQIEVASAVRAPVVNAARAQEAPAAAQSAVAAQATKDAARALAAPTRSAPVADDHGLRLTVRPDTHEVIATLVNTETNEVIRQIPGEETRRAAEVIRAITGQLIDKIV